MYYIIIPILVAITPYRDIANAPVVVGVCCDMCPEKERYMREYQANLSIFEMIPGTQDNRVCRCSLFNQV